MKADDTVHQHETSFRPTGYQSKDVFGWPDQARNDHWWITPLRG
jgi:hypothetical protein